jgi:hypothetical protein
MDLLSQFSAPPLFMNPASIVLLAMSGTRRRIASKRLRTKGGPYIPRWLVPVADDGSTKRVPPRTRPTADLREAGALLEELA